MKHNAILIHNGHNHLMIRPSYDNKVIIQQVADDNVLDKVTWVVETDELRSLLDAMEIADE